MADFVTDDRADATVVDCVISVGIEERWLQNGGREHDLVLAGVVIGVHRLRRHAPFRFVDRFAKLVDHSLMFKQRRPLHVSDQIVSLNFQCRVVSPFHRVADLGRDLVQLVQRLLLGLGSHPFQIADTAFIGFQQVGDKFIHAQLRFRLEVFRHIKLSRDFAQDTEVAGTSTACCVNAAFPAWFLFWNATQLFAVKFEVSIHEWFWQQ